MFVSLRKLAGRLLGQPVTAREPRRLAIDDVPHLGVVYPTVESIAITLSFVSPDGEHGTSAHTRTFEARARANFSFRCKNPNCRQGGFELIGLIDRAVGARRDAVSGTAVCAGVESPNASMHRRCMHELSYRIAIRYRPH